MKKHIKIKVVGTVQGVGYRDFVQQQAAKLGIEGTIQYSNHSAVLIYAWGTSDLLEQFIDQLYIGSKKSHVESVETESCSENRDFRGIFRIIGEEQ